MIHEASSLVPGAGDEQLALSAANGFENALGQVGKGTDLWLKMW